MNTFATATQRWSNRPPSHLRFEDQVGTYTAKVPTLTPISEPFPTEEDHSSLGAKSFQAAYEEELINHPEGDEEGTLSCYQFWLMENLRLAWAASKAVFGEKATPDIAWKIYEGTEKALEEASNSLNGDSYSIFSSGCDITLPVTSTVTRAALVKRINQYFMSNDDPMLAEYRFHKAKKAVIPSLGDYYIFDHCNDEIVDSHCTPELIGAVFGLLRDGEEVID